MCSACVFDFVFDSLLLCCARLRVVFFCGCVRVVPYVRNALVFDYGLDYVRVCVDL